MRDVAATLVGQEEQRQTPLTATNIEKLHADQVAFSEMVFGVPLLSLSTLNNANLLKRFGTLSMIY